jgi:hypothetical protein
MQKEGFQRHRKELREVEEKPPLQTVITSPKLTPVARVRLDLAQHPSPPSTLTGWE